MTNKFLQSVLAKKASSKKQNGFTLIELMVVVAIVGILSAVGLPELTKAQNKGKDAAAQATLTNAAKECALNLITESATVATAAHTAATAADGKFEGVTGACTLGANEIVMTLLSDNAANTATITFTGSTPGPVKLAPTSSTPPIKVG